jgi:uncharacterized membrane protein
MSTAMNDRGTVVGTGVASDDPADTWNHEKDRGFIARHGQALQLLPGVTSATGLNDREQVIGRQLSGDGAFAVLRQGGRTTRLPALNVGSGEAAVAVDINNRGQIAGYTISFTGSSHAVLWTVRRP